MSVRSPPPARIEPALEMASVGVAPATPCTPETIVSAPLDCSRPVDVLVSRPSTVIVELSVDALPAMSWPELERLAKWKLAGAAAEINPLLVVAPPARVRPAPDATVPVTLSAPVSVTLMASLDWSRPSTLRFAS